MPFRLFREHCILGSKGYVKDLRCLGRNLENVIIIDNSPISYSIQQENALPIISWYGDSSDTELFTYIPILEFLSRSTNVIKSLSKIVNGNEIVQNAAYILKMAEASEIDSEYSGKPLRVNNFLSVENSDQKYSSHPASTKKEPTYLQKKPTDIKENSSSDIMKLIKRMTSYTPSVRIKAIESSVEKKGKISIGSPSTRYSSKKAYEFNTPSVRDNSNACHSSMKLVKEEPKPCTIYSNLLKMSVNIKKEFSIENVTKKLKPVISINTLSKDEVSRLICTSTKAKPAINLESLQIRVSINSPKYSNKYVERPQSSISLYKPAKKQFS
jgi:NLI interacting factor-like phosphatase